MQRPFMEPNIDERGAQARLNGARLAWFVAACLLMIPHLSPLIRWPLFGILFVGGLFMRFEARKHWCVLRACGLKTRL